MQVVAITGGLGSGKSEVTKILGELGAHTLNADQIAKDVRDLPENLIKMAEILDSQILDDEGKLIPSEAAKVMFTDETKKRQVEELLHPLVLEEIARRTLEIEQQGSEGLVAIEVPLLAEVGWTFENVIVVTVPEEVAIERAVKRGMTEEDARTRRGQQATDEQRQAMGHNVYVVDNSSTREVLAEKVESIRDELLGLRIEDLSR